MHPRTLEGMRPLGVVHHILERAIIAPEAELHLDGRVIRARLADFALPETAFPHLTLVRQADVEAVLARTLEARGVRIERGTEAIAVQGGGEVARATLRSSVGTETALFDYVVGCDGQSSTVRAAAGIPWHGKRYGEEVLLADLELDVNLDPGVAHAFATRSGVLLVFAFGECARWRMLATRPARGEPLAPGEPGPPVAETDIQALLDQAGVDTRIASLVWSARYALQRRLAARFREGRLFLAGDAAHANSPAAGLGMNTGIQDALNLGWKLAFAQRANDPVVLLDSYQRERQPLDRHVLALTNTAFWVEASNGIIPRLLRGTIAPVLAPALPFMLRSDRLIAAGIRFVSQLRVPYRRSPISVEGTPRLVVGPRPGWPLGDLPVHANGHPTRLHTLLARPGVHVLLHRDALLPDHRGFGPYVTVHRLTSVPGTGVVAVRPDGVIGFRCGLVDPVQLKRWLARIGASESALPLRDVTDCATLSNDAPAEKEDVA
jgi:2-polyprenyl-6-methoxyphenol hydroxylase-like FAD-dependent oxidoreductase